MAAPCWVGVYSLLLFMLFLMTELHNVCNNSIFSTFSVFNWILSLNVLL